jgi:hypothetical protein
MGETSFIVEKTYIDCVGNDGRAIIGYVARMTWHGLSVPYTSLLYLDAAGTVTHKSRFSGPNQPEVVPGRFHWEDPQLGLSGLWRSTSSPINETLFESADGALHWNCRMPRAEALIHLNGEPDLSGLGYVEDLTLTVYPWKLPVETLFWGRFISAQHYLVWIEFGGETPRQWASLDGKPIQRAVISGERIGLDKGMALQFSNTTVLEQGGKIGEVVDGLSNYVPGFRQFLPHTFLHAQEFKWRSEGILLENGEAVDRGWAIHEKVIFR